jgi:DNA-directed RNA polymerase subunit L
MEKVSSIKLKKNDWDKELTNSRLEFNITGKNLNYVVINTLRRVILSNIPIYAFDKITINTNSSIFNNNYMRLRIENLPVIGIENNNEIFVEKEEEELEEEDFFDENKGIINDNIDINDDEDNSINSSSLDEFTMYLDFKNENKKIVTVGTSDAKFYYKQKKIDSPYKNNIPIIKLHPGKTIIMSAVTNLGIEKNNAKYSPVSVVFYKQKKDNDFDFIIESKGQLNEKKIISIAILNINNILDEFMKLVPDNKGMEGKLVIPDEDHTLGNLLADGLQRHKAVQFAGYNMPHPLGNVVEVHYKLNSGNLKKVLKDVISFYQNLFDDIGKKVNNIK